MAQISEAQAEVWAKIGSAQVDELKEKSSEEIMGFAEKSLESDDLTNYFADGGQADTDLADEPDDDNDDEAAFIDRPALAMFAFTEQSDFAQNPERKRKRKEKRLFRKIRRELCKARDRITQTNTESFLKSALLIVVPVLATGLWALFVPIIITIVALFISQGLDNVCRA